MCDEDYIEFYKIDAKDEWLNSAYDENGNGVNCDFCHSELRWDPINQNWYCPECDQKFDRAEYFNFIGAEPPGPLCLTSCNENYPLCKQICEHYEIDPNDPMLS